MAALPVPSATQAACRWAAPRSPHVKYVHLPGPFNALQLGIVYARLVVRGVLYVGTGVYFREEANERRRKQFGDGERSTVGGLGWK